MADTRRKTIVRTISVDNVSSVAVLNAAGELIGHAKTYKGVENAFVVSAGGKSYLATNPNIKFTPVKKKKK